MIARIDRQETERNRPIVSWRVAVRFFRFRFLLLMLSLTPRMESSFISARFFFWDLSGVALHHVSVR